VRQRKPELWAAFGLVVYTVGRFVAAGGTMTQYGIDARWFLFWDVLTIPPYVWGIGKLVRGLSIDEVRWGQLVFASAVALAAFLGPYVYLVYAGAEEFPILAWALLAAVIALLAANAVVDVRRKIRSSRAKALEVS
jgi:hypothetical protein